MSDSLEKTATTLDALVAESQKLSALLDSDPVEAVRQARLINVESEDRLTAMSVRAAILVDGGAATQQLDAIEEGLRLLRDLYAEVPDITVAYNLANALASIVGVPPQGRDWLDYQEQTREQRAEARRLYWSVSQDESAPSDLRTQAWTNLANQLSRTYRLGEAHDARLAALAIDPSNGVAAGCAARDLMWLFSHGICSDLTRVEAAMLAKIAERNRARVEEFAGAVAADDLSSLAGSLNEPLSRSPHQDPFIRWVERERLTLAPAVELVDPTLGKLDWLMLPGVREKTPGPDAVTPPPIFAMLNSMKADFILARDLAWRATNEANWPATGRFADTLDYATYGPDASALVLAHRTALDLLDKVAVTANHYFELGIAPNKIYFGKLWRESGGKKPTTPALLPLVADAIRGGAHALYGLVELAEDYESKDGILHPQKELRNAGTHRFVVLHDLGDPSDCRKASEIEHHERDRFESEVLRALRVARSALQMLTFAITQHERTLAREADGLVGTLHVPDHDWVRGRSDGPSLSGASGVHGGAER